jgi:hypothetical protein
MWVQEVQARKQIERMAHLVSGGQSDMCRRVGESRHHRVQRDVEGAGLTGEQEGITTRHQESAPVQNEDREGLFVVFVLGSVAVKKAFQGRLEGIVAGMKAQGAGKRLLRLRWQGEERGRRQEVLAPDDEDGFII